MYKLTIKDLKEQSEYFDEVFNRIIRMYKGCLFHQQQEEYNIALYFFLTANDLYLRTLAVYMLRNSHNITKLIKSVKVDSTDPNYILPTRKHIAKVIKKKLKTTNLTIEEIDNIHKSEIMVKALIAKIEELRDAINNNLNERIQECI